MKIQHQRKEVIKEVKNLAVNNEVFDKLEYKSILQEIKQKALFLQTFMTMECNRDLKSRGYINGSYKRVHMDNNIVLLFIPDFYLLKYACTVTSKEETFQDSPPRLRQIMKINYYS